MVLAFGLDHIIVSSDRPKDPAASRFLENTASTRGKPSFTAEAGRSGPVDPSDAAVLVKGVQNVIGHLKMSSQAVTPVARPIWIEPLVSVAADHDGVFHPLVEPRRPRDQGRRRSARSPIISTGRSPTCSRPDAGIVLFIRAVPSLKKGDTIASVGVVKR